MKTDMALMAWCILEIKTGPAGSKNDTWLSGRMTQPRAAPSENKLPAIPDFEQRGNQTWVLELEGKTQTDACCGTEQA
jgi:hypothetical protein